MMISMYNISWNDSELLRNDSLYSRDDSGYPRASLALLRALTDGLEMYGLPVLILLGLLGNGLSFLVFVTTPLRKNSSSVYLAALALSDNGFLFTLIFHWLVWLRVDVYYRPGWCQFLTYLNSVCGFLSVAYVVAFTCERYIVVFYPLRRQTWCSVRRARLVVLVLTVSALVFYSYITWTNVSVLDSRGNVYCMPDSRHMSLVAAMGLLDTVITLLVASLAIICMNMRLIARIAATYRRREHLRTGSFTSTNHVTRVTSPAVGYVRHTAESVLAREALTAMTSSASEEAARGRVERVSRTTRMLLAVSTTFLVLNLPSHCIRFYGLLRNSRASYFLELLQQLFMFLFYINFSINILLYSLCGKNFRDGLKKMLRDTAAALRGCRQCQKLNRKFSRRSHVATESTLTMGAAAPSRGNGVAGGGRGKVLTYSELNGSD